MEKNYFKNLFFIKSLLFTALFLTLPLAYRSHLVNKVRERSRIDYKNKSYQLF